MEAKKKRAGLKGRRISYDSFSVGSSRSTDKLSVESRSIDQLSFGSSLNDRSSVGARSINGTTVSSSRLTELGSSRLTELGSSRLTDLGSSRITEVSIEELRSAEENADKLCVLSEEPSHWPRGSLAERSDRLAGPLLDQSNVMPTEEVVDFFMRRSECGS